MDSVKDAEIRLFLVYPASEIGVKKWCWSCHV
jgi:hypothetical protein